MKENPYVIRHAELTDLSELKQLFVESVKNVCLKDYTEEQIEAWTSMVTDRKGWVDRLTGQYFLVAEDDQKIVGFASMDRSDQLDLLYVHKDFQRKGVAEKLYTVVEAEARRTGAASLTSNVSITAKPFFEKKGFKILKEQKNKIDGQVLVNYKMEKILHK